MDFTTSKLIMLFVLEKAEIPLKEDTLLNMCSSNNNWVPYMECKNALTALEEAGFIINTTKSLKDILYAITTDGRDCLSHFYTKIPSTMRDDIQEDLKQNIIEYKKLQEYFADYYKNDDGTYTVVLKIISPSQQAIIDLKLNIANRNSAKWIFKNWSEKAPQVYEMIYELLIE